MGNCFTKAAPPACKHERLNEHNDRYFAKVQARNSMQSPKRWWRRTTESDHSHNCEAPTLLDPSETLPEEAQVVLQQETTATSPPSSPLSQPKEDEEQEMFMVDSTVSGWQIKRKGHALQLRLAKNRFLQLAAEGNQKNLSPITLDSGSKPKRNFNPLITPRNFQEEWNSDFESNMSNGVLWVEIARKNQVTAVAMSRTKSEYDGPLLLAVGGEDGLVSVAQILDRHSVDNSTDNTSISKFGDTLNVPVDGRVRSLDFSAKGDYLVVAGDGCAAILIHILYNPQTKALYDLAVLQKVDRVDRIYAAQFSPDGSTLAIGGFDGKVAFTTLDAMLSEETPSSFVEVSRPGLIYCLDWSPDDNYIAIGGSDKCCAILDKNFNLVSETLRSTAVQTVKWNHNGTYLAIGDREVLVLEGGSFRTKCEVCSTPTSSAASSTKYRITCLCWSPDDTFLAVGGSDGICMVVETKGFALVHEVNRLTTIRCLAWGQQKVNNSDYRRYLAISDESSSVAILKAGADTEGSLSESDEASSEASSAYFSTASDWVLREDCFRDIDDTPPELPSGIKPQGKITSVAFSRCNKTKSSAYLAYAADDCSLTIMTTRDWKAVFVSSAVEESTD